VAHPKPAPGAEIYAQQPQVHGFVSGLTTALQVHQ